MVVINNEHKTITTEVFLNEIHGVGADIYFNTDNRTWWNKPQTYAKANWTLRKYHQDEDICYIVNAGGSKNNEINRINACFIDWDCGKDSEGNYFSLDIVEEKKAEFLVLLDTSPLTPSFIVETRNGYHVYWLLYPGTTHNQFRELQQRLAYYFQSDPSVTNPARVMRLPGYDWVKLHKNCARFSVRIIEYNPVRYYFSELNDAFPVVSEEEFQRYKSKNKGRKDRKSAHNNNGSYYNDDTRSIYVGTKPEEEVLVDNMGQAIEYLKSINPAKYLGIQTQENNTTLCCPFHPDQTPSASLYEYNGYYYLKCHSTECGIGPMTIIDIVKKIEKCETNDAIKILMEFYNIRVDQSWKPETKNILEQNIEIIDNIDGYKEQYPNLYNCVHRIKKDLISKIEFAKDHIEFKSCRNEFMFVASLRKFQKLATNNKCHDGDVGRQNERVDRYCLLGLMRKLPDEEISNNLLANAYGQREAIQKSLSSNKKNTPRTQFYSIPEYTPELLEDADAIAKNLKDAGARMNSISYDLVFSIFGKEKAKEIYPQIKFREITASGKKLQRKIEAILKEELAEKRYSRTTDIVAELQKEYDWKTIADRRIKKYLPGLFQTMNLIEITANKQLKEKYGIESKGYPKIIIKAEAKEEKDEPHNSQD